MHWSWQRLIALKQRQLQLPIHASCLIKEEKSAAVHPVRIPTAIPQSAWMWNAASAVSCLALWAAPNPSSTGSVPCQWNINRSGKVTIGSHLLYSCETLWIISTTCAQFSCSWSLEKMSLSVLGGGSAQMQSHWKGQGLQGCVLTARRGQTNYKGPSQQGRSASVSQAKPNMRSKDAEWRSEFSNVPRTAVTCCQTELWFIQQICFYTGELKHLHRLWLRTGGGKALWVQHAYEQTHVHAWVCDSEKTAILTSEDFIPDSFSWNLPPLIFFFGCIKLGILKACFLVWWFLGFFSFFLSLNSLLFWICFKMNVAFIPIPGS